MNLKCFKSTLKQIDLNGQAINLTINKKSKHKTLLGSILTILALIVIFLSFYLIGKENLNKQKFNVLTAIEQKLERENIFFYSKQFCDSLSF